MVWEDGPDWVLKASPWELGEEVRLQRAGDSRVLQPRKVSGGKGALDYAGDDGHARPPTRLGNAGAACGRSRLLGWWGWKVRAGDRRGRGQGHRGPGQGFC